MTDQNEDVHESFMSEEHRCPECGMFPPDHDIICPNNPSLTAVSPADALTALEAKLAELEASPEPDFQAIGDLLAQIESVKTNVNTQSNSN